QLNEEAEEEVEIRLLSDSRYAEEFDLVVDEIVDRYVADEFKGGELERVRNYFFRSTDRQDKLRFARTLKERERKEPPPSPNPKPIKRRGWLPTLSFAPAWALAASFIVVAGIGLLAYRSY